MYKILKKFIVMILVIAMNMTTYAAVGANDGSAFITKAEFDALVNTFNEQMDRYEASLITKIDGSIANYLSGQSNYRTLQLVDYASRVKSMGSNYDTFYNYPTQAFAVSNKNNYGQAGSYYYYYIGQAGVKDAAYNFGRESSNGYQSGFGYNSYGSKNSLYLFKNNTDMSDAGSGYDDKAVFLDDNRSYNNFITIAVNESYASLNQDQLMSEAQIKNGTTTSHTININNQNAYNGTFQNVESCSIIGKNITARGTISEEWNNNGAQSFAGAGSPSSNIITSQVLYGVNTANKTYYDGDQQTITGCKASDAGGKFISVKAGFGAWNSWEPSSGFNWTYKYYWHKIFTTNAINLSNYGASQVIGSAVKLYNGVPLTKVNTPGSISFNCTITNTVGNDTYLTISDEPFDNDNRYSTKTYTVGGKTYDHILYNEKITPGKSKEVKFNVDYVSDKNNGVVLYYRLSQETYTDRTVKMSMVLDSTIQETTDQ